MRVFTCMYAELCVCVNSDICLVFLKQKYILVFASTLLRASLSVHERAIADTIRST